MRSTLLRWAAVGAWSACLLPAPAAAAPLPQDAPAVATAPLLDVELDLYLERYSYVRGTIGGEPTDIVLDTGAGMTVVDEALADELGLSGFAGGTARGVGGEGRPIRLGTAAIRLGEEGELDLGRIQVAILDLEEVHRRLGRRMPVILGKEFFREHVVTLDYLDRRLRVHAPGTFEAPTGAVEHRARVRADGHVMLELEYEDLGPSWFVVDTGSGESLALHSPYVARERLLERYERLGERRVGGVGGSLPAKNATAARVLLAGHEFRDVPVTLATESGGAFGDARAAGNLGAGLLSRFRVTFDYRRERIVFEPGPDLDAPFRKDRSGLVVERVDDAFHVVAVSPGSPADAAGFEVGLVLAAVDGEALGPELLRTKLRQPAGTTLVIRDSGGVERSLELADYF